MAFTVTHRLRWVIVLIAAPSALLVVSCGFPVAGGLLAGLGILGAVLLGLLSVATLDACSNNACLRPAPPDVGADSLHACLTSRLPDARIGPCLTPPRSKGDASRTPDVKSSACLAPRDPDAGASLLVPESRARVIARLEEQGALPAELAERLRRLPG